ncbi:uncharacterized protein FMAN_14186 [Fusarium mangiferae]|uniref:Uncharacterized protein n=1 Tax=Fusarium mangiferae TaxID=192010 RepID=A0A1L7UBQ1_FUSMA|nr:uncharacterized protein FMAN_14186 [Fusarium mangiferae]CVL08154.1 uncharacterized protein FMAN_14186 [Fusarium mangiferae]
MAGRIQEPLGIAPHALATLVSGLERATWKPSDLKGVSTLCNPGIDLVRSSAALWNGLVGNKKIRREEDSGNLLRAEGFCCLTISRTTHIVPLTISGQPPMIDNVALETGTITHIEKGKIVIDAGTTVLFAILSEYTGQVMITNGSNPAAK